MEAPDLVRSFVTVFLFLAFLGICWWAYNPRNRSRFENDGMLVFEDDEKRVVRSGRADEIPVLMRACMRTVELDDPPARVLVLQLLQLLCPAATTSRAFAGA